jgi:eukaryotic-like serine/threonine-protein kinase
MIQAGATFGPYLVRHRLGAGGMGEVYLAFDSRLQRDVALKVLTAGGADAETRLIREARLASALGHPNICTVFEAGEIDGQAFIAMERVAGQPLSDLIRSERLSSGRVIRLGVQMADGLAHAHAQGVVHRDFKSGNVIVGQDGRLKILDFGIAIRQSRDSYEPTAVATESVEGADPLAGTLPYMAPEVLRGGAADARGDVWALGVVLFEMAAGRRPFAGDTQYELTSAILTTPAPDLRGDVPAGLQSIVRKCLTKEPGERYQRASEVKAALEAIGSMSGVPNAPSAATTRSRRWAIGPAVAVVAAIVVAVIGAAVWSRGRPAGGASSGGPRIHAIAVLPLANLSGDATQDFFADGMTEALITDLARVKGLDVISRTSVVQYKGTQKALRQIAHELGVDAVVEGSVIRAGDRVRITAQLIEASTDRHLWANDYDRDPRDVLALQHDVARAIAHEVRATLTPQAEAVLTGGRRVNPAAHDLYLKGRALVYRYNEASIVQAIALFEEAIRIDPEFAQAWAGLAAAHSERGIWGVVGSRETGARAHEAITRALALDSSIPEAYAVLGNISTVYDWDWTGAERALKKSVELAPGEAHAYQYYAALMQALRRFPEGVAAGEIERRLDPASPIVLSSLGRARYRARQFDAAISDLKDVIALDPAYTPAYARLADVYLALGQHDEAVRWLDKGQAVGGGTRRQTDGYAMAYALAGRRREAEAVLRELIDRSKTSDQMAYSIAQVQAALGDKDDAFVWLNRAYDQHSANLFLVNSELKFDTLRTDPRFQDLLRRMHFPPS